MNKNTFNLRRVTGQESGIVVYGDDSIIVLNWSQMEDDSLPAIFLGGIISLRHEGIEVEETYHVDDVRNEIPGSIWATEDDDGAVVNTDMNIVHDENDDLPLIFGFDAINGGQGEVEPVAGQVYILNDGTKIIAPTDWN